MAAAMWTAGLEPWDVTMSDLLSGSARLDTFQGEVQGASRAGLAALRRRGWPAWAGQIGPGCWDLPGAWGTLLLPRLQASIAKAWPVLAEADQPQGLRCRWQPSCWHVLVLQPLERSPCCRAGLRGRLQLRRRAGLRQGLGGHHQAQPPALAGLHRLLPQARPEALPAPGPLR